MECDALEADMRQTLESRRLFPFVQFTACGKCTRSSHSEAVRIHTRMKSLAVRLGRDFHAAIEAAAAEFKRRD